MPRDGTGSDRISPMTLYGVFLKNKVNKTWNASHGYWLCVSDYEAWWWCREDEGKGEWAWGMARDMNRERGRIKRAAALLAWAVVTLWQVSVVGQYAPEKPAAVPEIEASQVEQSQAHFSYSSSSISNWHWTQPLSKSQINKIYQRMIRNNKYCRMPSELTRSAAKWPEGKPAASRAESVLLSWAKFPPMCKTDQQLWITTTVQVHVYHAWVPPFKWVRSRIA